MRILFFIHSLAAGGAERVVTTLANKWTIAGHELSIVTLEDAHADFFCLDSKVRRVSIGFPLSPVSFSGRFWMTLRRVHRLRMQLRVIKPDVAISMMDTSNIIMAFAGLGVTKTVRIGSERTYPPSAQISRAWQLLRRLTYRLLRGVVAQTEEGSDWLARNTSVRQVWVVPNPISLPLERREPIIDPASVRSAPKRVLSLGRFVSEKAFEVLIDAFQLVTEQFPNWELAIVGDGPERLKLESQIRENSLHGKVKLVGTVGNPSDWYASADLFVLSSRFEGFPNALLEALAHGLPVVATDCLTGPRAIVRHSIDGLLVPPENARELADAMAMLMSDDALRAQMGHSASQGAQRFSIESVAAQWIEIFEQQRSPSQSEVK